MRSALKRRPARQTPPASQVLSFMAPIGGLVTNENFATQSGKPVARVMDNYFPLLRGVMPRRGSRLYATIDTGGDAVQTMFRYLYGDTEKLFAADGDSIFDISIVADAEVVPTADVSGLSNGLWAAQMMENSGGGYLNIVNGADAPRQYDGSSWSTPSWSGSGLTVSNLSNIWTHGQRLWFIEKDTMNAWYAGINAITGSLTKFPLAGVFKKGGSLLIGATWSVAETGEGIDDKIIFISTEGEMAVYHGYDPASQIELEGVYEMPVALSRLGHYRVAGTPHILTAEGIIPVSAAVSLPVQQQSIKATTQAIEDQWLREMIYRTSVDWQVLRWPENNMLWVSNPVGNSSRGVQNLVQNIRTGAWCRYKQHDMHCGEVFQRGGYIGASDGKVYQVEVGGSDAGSLYECIMCLGFQDLGAPAYTKSVKSMRSRWTTFNPVSVRMSCSVDDHFVPSSYPDSIDELADDVWDVAHWDYAQWDSGLTEEYTYKTMWVSAPGTGYSHAPVIQQAFGIANSHLSILNAIDILFEVGGVMT